MDVVNAEQARIAEEAGACAVMALERVPADIRKDGMTHTIASHSPELELTGLASFPVACHGGGVSPFFFLFSSWDAAIGVVEMSKVVSLACLTPS